MYGLPSFVLSPFNKDIIDSPENDQAIDAMLKAYKDKDKGLNSFVRSMNNYFINFMKNEDNEDDEYIEISETENLEDEKSRVKAAKDKFIKNLEKIRVAEEQEKQEQDEDTEDEETEDEISPDFDINSNIDNELF